MLSGSRPMRSFDLDWHKRKAKILNPHTKPKAFNGIEVGLQKTKPFLYFKG